MAAAKRVKRPRKKGSKKGMRARFPGLLFSLGLLMASGLVLAVIYLIPIPVKGPGRAAGPVYEDFKPAPKTVPVPQKRERAKRKSHIPERPKVAIIIDDMGHNPHIDRLFFRLEPTLAFAFLPYARYSKGLAVEAKRSGHDVLVHIPMEPDNPAIDPGPGVLTTSMDLDQLIGALDRAMKQVPGAVGINNHMGSKFTTDRQAMERFLALVRSKGLFFVDSRTTAKTVAYETARSMGVPCAQRAVFLDPEPDRKIVERELKRLVSLAKKRGSAVAIGHPHRITYEVLYKRLPLIKKQVRLVPIHRLVE